MLSDIEAFPEVFGECASFIPLPGTLARAGEGELERITAEDWASDALKILQSPGLWERMSDNGKALALSDNDNDGKADRVITFIKGLTRPHGIAFHNGYLYIGETDQITRFKYDDFDKESGKREGPIHDLPTAYSTPPGFTFYTREPFPEEYRGDLFVALHGSWNRSVPTGYKVIRITIEGGKPAGTEDFATGWLECDNVCGRPVDVLVGSDGGLVVSDDGEGIIYRITTSP